MSLDEYLGIVAKNSGYSPTLVLYTRLSYCNINELHKELEQAKILSKLHAKGIDRSTPLEIFMLG